MDNIIQIRKLVLTALFSALIIAGAYLAVPIGPVPIVLANMFAIAAGLLLGPVYGGAAVLIYLLLGTLGLPVFSGAKGGIAVLTGPTGGYLIGYFFGALTAGILSIIPGRTGKARFLYFIAALAGIAVIYVPGLLILKGSLDLTWADTLGKGLLPFIPGALLKVAAAGTAAWFLGPKLKEQ